VHGCLDKEQYLVINSFEELREEEFTMRKDDSIRLAVLTFVAVAIAVFLPCLGLAGSLEPSVAPAPTMKTLDQIPPTWDQTLRADDGLNGNNCNSSRFKCVLDGAGVLDKETGLVWEKLPTSVGDSVIWSSALSGCADLFKGGRLGWRLPALQELLSLVDPTQENPALPSGHPFSGVRTDAAYWTGTTAANQDGSASSEAFVVDIYNGHSAMAYKVGTFASHVWCVRGGQGLDIQ
jgi:hypothetical protein